MTEPLCAPHAHPRIAGPFLPRTVYDGAGTPWGSRRLPVHAPSGVRAPGARGSILFPARPWPAARASPAYHSVFFPGPSFVPFASDNELQPVPTPRSRREGLERYQTQTRFSLRAAAPAGPLTSPKQAVIHPKALGLNIEVSRGQEPAKAQPPPIGDLEGLRLAKNSLCFPLLSESSGFSWFVWFGRRKWVFAIDLTQILERHEGGFYIFGKTKESKELNTQR